MRAICTLLNYWPTTIRYSKLWRGTRTSASNWTTQLPVRRARVTEFLKTSLRCRAKSKRIDSIWTHTLQAMKSRWSMSSPLTDRKQTEVMLNSKTSNQAGSKTNRRQHTHSLKTSKTSNRQSIQIETKLFQAQGLFHPYSPIVSNQARGQIYLPLLSPIWTKAK